MTLYIKQTTRASSLSNLSNTQGVLPGHIAWVDTVGRYTAAPAGTYPIDGVHVISGQDSCIWVDDSILVPTADGYAAVNLSTVRYCDPATTVESGSQIGTSGAPFASLQAAIDDCPDGGTVYITPNQASFASIFVTTQDVLNIAVLSTDASGVANSTGYTHTDNYMSELSVASGTEVRVSGLSIATINLDGDASIICNNCFLTKILGGDGTSGNVTLNNCRIESNEYISFWAQIYASTLFARNTSFYGVEVYLRNTGSNVLGQFSLVNCLLYPPTPIEFVAADGYLIVDNSTHKSFTNISVSITNGKAIPDGAPTIYPANTSDNTLTGSGGSQVAGTHLLPIINNTMLIVGCRCWAYQVSDASVYGYADFQILLRRSAGTWTIASGTDSALINTVSGTLISAFSADVNADVNSGSLRILATPGSNNVKTKVEFWKSTEMYQD